MPSNAQVAVRNTHLSSFQAIGNNAAGTSPHLGQSKPCMAVGALITRRFQHAIRVDNASMRHGNANTLASEQYASVHVQTGSTCMIMLSIIYAHRFAHDHRASKKLHSTAVGPAPLFLEDQLQSFPYHL